MMKSNISSPMNAMSQQDNYTALEQQSWVNHSDIMPKSNSNHNHMPGTKINGASNQGRNAHQLSESANASVVGHFNSQEPHLVNGSLTNQGKPVGGGQGRQQAIEGTNFYQNRAAYANQHKKHGSQVIGRQVPPGDQRPSG
mmetsp:Transcript_9889/g.16630  ORF Transcript_9889/g.16630 Transcript_9889/m.16630 type:complete len:141 (-) Transcript_9889:321-743(-)